MHGHITVDGIPLGPGFGVSVEHPDETFDYLGCGLVPVARIRGPRDWRAWLTRRNRAGVYEAVRELPADALVVAEMADRRIEVQHGQARVTVWSARTDS